MLDDKILIEIDFGTGGFSHEGNRVLAEILHELASWVSRGEMTQGQLRSIFGRDGAVCGEFNWTGKPKPSAGEIPLLKLCYQGAVMADDAANYLTNEQILPCDEGNAVAEGLTTLAMRMRDASRGLTWEQLASAEP